MGIVACSTLPLICFFFPRRGIGFGYATVGWGGVNRIPESDLASGYEECGVCSEHTLTELQHLHSKKIVFLF